MYVALNSTLTAGGKLTWTDFARLASRTGYRGVDVMLGPAMQAGVDATRSLLHELGLQPAVVGLPVEFRKDDAEFKAGLTKLDEAAAFSVAIGCPRITTWILPSSDLPKLEQRKVYVDRLGACAQVLARHKARLGLEYVSPVHLRKLRAHEFIYRMDEMLDMAKECGPNCGVLLDSWHWHHAGGTVKDILNAGRERIIHVQVADAPKLPPEQIKDSERLMPGEGIIDFKAFFAALKKVGYADGISPEIFGRGLKEMKPEEGATLGLKTTREAMWKAGV